MSNIINAVFTKDKYSDGTETRTEPVWQYDYGMVLKIEGVELPVSYEVHFANDRRGNSVTSIGDSTGVAVPDIVLQNGGTIYAWVYLHTGDSDGETEYTTVIPVNRRAKPTNETPTPVQQDVITQAIAALDAAVEMCEENVEHYPKVENGYWYVWDAEEGTYVDTGVRATGEPGPTGNGIARIDFNPDYTLTITYTNGQSYTTGSIRGEDGQDGYSPSASVSKVEDTATITITDKNGTTTAQVTDGVDGQDGQDGITPNVTAGTTTTGEPGTDASVTRHAGSPDSAPVFDFVIPKGAKGDPGEVTEAELLAGLATKAAIIEDSVESSAIASFPDGANGSPMKVVATIDPVQSGSGDPYPAGGGKNIWDEQWEVSGSAIQSKNRISCEAGQWYYINVLPSNGWKFYDNGGTVLSTFYNNYAQAPEGAVEMSFKLGSAYGTTYKNDVIVAKTTESGVPVSYSPYSNIRPISGWTGCNVSRTGKNLFNKATVTENKYLNSAGVISTSTGYYTSDYIHVKSGETYVFSGYTPSGTAAYNCFYDSSKNFVSSQLATVNPMTIPFGCEYVRLSIRGTGISLDDIQFESGSSVSSYAPYIAPTTYPITWQSTAGTVYGGTLTVNEDGTVVLTVDRGRIYADGSFEVANIAYHQSTGLYYTIITNAIGAPTNNPLPISDKFKPATGVAIGNCYITNNGKTLIAVLPDQTITTKASATQWFAENPTEFIYKLATPVTYTLTAEQVGQILSLKGTNNVWADTGNVSVNYSADTKLYIDKAIANAIAIS